MPDASPLHPFQPAPQRILVRGVNWLGDAVMTIPALKSLRQHFPNSEISILTHEKLTDLWHEQPGIDRVLTCLPGQTPLAVGRRLKAEGFDLAVVLPNSLRSALEVWFSGIPERVGFGGGGRSWLLSRPVERRRDAARMRKLSFREIRRVINGAEHPGRPAPANPTHQAFEYLHLVSVLGAVPDPLPPRLHLPPEELSAVARHFDMAESESRLLFGLNPGAEYGPAKRWPTERFVSAAVEICHRTACQWIVFGGARDREVAQSIARRICQSVPPSTPLPARSVAGETTLRQLMGLLAACRVLLTNDTGPMHLAAALGTPVVALFGSTSPELTGPGFAFPGVHRVIRSTAACSPCFRRECPIDFRCMTGIQVEQVVEAVVEATASRIR